MNRSVTTGSPPGAPSRLAALLASRRLSWALPALAALLVLPSIGTGLIADDFIIRAVETVCPPRPTPIAPFDVFHFTDPSYTPQLMDDGAMPWWTSRDLRLAFFRPLASASHWLDFHLFPGSPWAMHAVSIAWLVAAVAVAVALYRRLLGTGWPAGLAALFFAVDPGHGIPAGWIATRNALLALFFGLSAVYAQDRARRDGSRRAALLAPLLTAASLASGEPGLATLALLFAHAIVFDEGWRARARALAPHALVALMWAAIYRARGYGAAHSNMYVDPLTSPADFLRRAIQTIPLNLGARFGGPPASIVVLLSQRVLVPYTLASLGFVILAAILLAPAVRKEPAARFFAISAALSALPIAGTVPNDRNLCFVGFAAFGLAAIAVRRAVELRSWPTRIYAGWLVVYGIVLATLSMPAASRSMMLFARLSREPLSRVLLDRAVRRQTAVFVNPPTHFWMSHLVAMRAGTSEPIPARLRSLVPGMYRSRITRTGPDQLTVHVEGGILPPPGTWPAGQGEAPAASLNYTFQSLTSFVRGPDDPMHAGDTIPLPGLTVQVVAVAEGAGPSDMTFTFDHPLDAPSLRWLMWKDGGYVPFPVPEIGQAVDLPPATLVR